MVISGSCERRNIKFKIHGQIPNVVACHCTQCRKNSGHVWAATSVGDEDLIFLRKDGLKWYVHLRRPSGDFAKIVARASFYKEDGRDVTEVAAGALDAPTGLKTEKHIYVADKGDYYLIPQDEPQFDQY